MKDKHAAILEAAALGLSQASGQAVQLAFEEELDSQHTVLRCHMVASDGAHGRVVIKHVPFEKSARKNKPKNVIRFHNEWATLRFLDELQGGSSLAPRVYLSDRKLGLMVLEDLGQRPSVQDLLYGDDLQSAAAALVHIGTGLGQLHAATTGLEKLYREAQGRFGATTPYSDATLDLRRHKEMLTECFAALNIEAAPDFFDEIAGVAETIHGPSRFRALCHNDAGAHNFLQLDGHVKLLDFEFAGYQHALTDLVPARLGFPPSYRGRRSPPGLVEQLENAYRHELSQAIPESMDDKQFASEREAACTHLVLAKLVGMWKVYLQYRLATGEAYDSQEGRKPERAEYFRRMNLTYLTSYLETTTALCFRPAIRDTIQSVVEALLSCWPGLSPLPLYPAFEKAS